MSANQNEPIAIIGMGCRFPGGASSPSKLWDLLNNPRDVARDIPTSRFNVDRFYHKDGHHHGTTNARQAYLLEEDIAEFDAKFFSVPPAEAEAIDPQQRILLEVTYEALEASGHTISQLSDSDTGVFVGLMSQDYFALNGQDINSVPTYAASGTAASNASSRLSYFFNWHGPSMTIDTACSSSMVAVNEAVQNLRAGTSRVAVACGTNLCLSAFTFITLSKLSMLSPTSRCHMWDNEADGYARGEGVACIVLKTLSAALEDGDHIEGIIRAVGVNQDGRTKGLTMPSAAAQAALIKSTYAKAGLDPTKASDRCQYFEAHGTGTKAGDPQEAEALMRAFFPDPAKADGELLVGSVKTVVGHTEGTAGLAGLMKTCLALQQKTVPPNMLFNSLNPDLEPFTANLRVSTASQPWPEVPGSVLRASVNSFGFGGTNAHCILEAYTPPAPKAIDAVEDVESQACTIPVAFSAATDKSLLALLQSTLDALDNDTDIKLEDLAYTLNTKRSALGRRLAMSASSIDELRKSITATLESSEEKDSAPPSVMALPAASSLLGVFTGQGAQWQTMGAQLVASTPLAKSTIDKLDTALASLPAENRPEWTLLDALNDPTTDVGKASFSQPLCTAVQIVLVDLLQAANVKFEAVVGHSSGEIAAAYAAGFLNATDAIRIAYYRGFYAKLAAGASGEQGAMLAAGTTYEDAKELCEVDDFVGRICIAAHNSPTSVTLSGDNDAIEQALTILEEEEKFARLLKVDTAYHSSHMLKCADSYLDALKACNIQVKKPEADSPQWFSSVRDGGIVTTDEELDGQYWVDNMVQPVLFSPAVQNSMRLVDKTINGALEVGPHPALQSPAKDSIMAAVDREILYAGTLKRGADSSKAFADALGYLWSHFGPATVSLGAFQQAAQPNVVPQRVKNLPNYPWTHDRAYFAESRQIKTFHSHPTPFHDLLGVLTPDGTTEEWRWKNILSMNELKWLSGHSLQGQVVFPATAYICIAMEAAMQLAQGQSVESIDLLNLEIRKAIAIHESTGTELLISMTKVTAKTNEITADFTAYSTLSKGANLILNCCGQVRVHLGEDSASRFAPRRAPESQLTPVDIDSFYKILRDDFGFGYEGPFRALTDVSRKASFATGTIRSEGFEDGETALLFHPGMLDSALQGLNAAHSAPGDGRLWAIVAPTFCRRISLIPSLCGKNMTENVEIDCTITDPRDTHVTGDVEVYSEKFAQKIIEVEGLTFSPFAAATEENDRFLFQESILALDKPDAYVIFGDRKATPEEAQKALDAERAAFYYIKHFHLSVSTEKRKELPWYRQALLANCERLYHFVNNGEHPFAPASWINDTHEEIIALMETYPATDSDFNLTKAVGEHLLLPTVLSGDTSILQYMTKDNYLEKYYTDAIGFEQLNFLIAGVMEQICTKSPRAKFLEIGAGTGGATKAIFDRVGHAYSSYTYTDISSAFFEHAAERFETQVPKMIFKTLDVTKSIEEQGYEPYSYDVVVASNVLHATDNLKAALDNTRKLLKPGGFLVMIEIIRSDVMRFGLVMGGLPGWWVGEADGRLWGPSLSLPGWDNILKETGFGGIETNSPMLNPVGVPGSIIVARAQNEEIAQLTRPLTSEYTAEKIPLVILGGNAPHISPVRDQLCLTLRPRFGSVIKIDSLETIPTLPENYHVLSLTECDANLFENMEEHVFENLKTVMGSAYTILWVLQGRQTDNPHAGTMFGVFRTLLYELPGSLLQTLDVDTLKIVHAKTIAESMLKLRIQSDLVRSGETEKIWYEFEPELVIQDDGTVVVPRVRPADIQNDRYNSSKRSITRTMETEKTHLALEYIDNAYEVSERHAAAPTSDDIVTVNVTCSFLSSIKTPVGYVFASLGEDAATGTKTLCFSGRNESVVKVPRSWTIALDEVEVDGQYMSFVIADLTVQWLLQMLPVAGTLVAYEADPVVASLLSQQLNKIDRKVLFITSTPGMTGRNWVYVHPSSAKREIAAILPADTTLFIDGSEAGSENHECGRTIASAVSATCEITNMSRLTASQASVLPAEAPNSVTDLLERVTDFASSLLSAQATPDGAPLDILPLARVVAKLSNPNPSSLVYWREGQQVPVQMQPVFHREDLFRADRTYWLAGLAGDTGRSLADFMIAHSAKHVVLTSRTPKPDEAWVARHAANGATVKYISW